VADALSDLVEFGRAQGLEWWTSEQICRWEMRRRGVDAEFISDSTFTLRAARPLSGATLLLLKSRQQPRPVIINGRPAKGRRWNWHGFEFDAVTLDVAGKVNVQLA
jgi:hypothetical protein